MTSRTMKIAYLTVAALSLTSPLWASSDEASKGQLRYVYNDKGEKVVIQPGTVDSSQTITETRRVNLFALQAEAGIKDPKPTEKRVATKVNDCGKGTEFKTVPVSHPTYDDKLVDADQTVKQIDTSTRYKGGDAVFGITSHERGFLTSGEDVYFDAVVGDQDLHLAKLGKTTNSDSYWDAFMTPLGKVFTLNTVFQFGSFRYHGLPSDNYSYNMNNSNANQATGTGGEVGDVSSNSYAKNGAITNTQNQTNDQTQLNNQTQLNDQNAYLSSWTQVEQDLTAKINSTNIANANANANAKADADAAATVKNPYANRPNPHQGGCKKNKWGQEECNY
ncbi:MAG: hypothetical protein PHW63_05130 [Alphaproteobacteria bacterium]|nr:hypothetical protein [Alphaproteobacteria bacterium]